MRDYGNGTYGAPHGRYGDLAFGLATLTATLVTRAGLLPALAAATAAGDRITSRGPTFLVVLNDGEEPIVVVPSPTARVIGLEVLPRAVDVDPGETAFIGPFPRWLYASEDGLFDVDYSDAANVLVAALTLDREF